MKPHRIRMTHNLLINYGLYEKMEIFVRIDREGKRKTREKTREKGEKNVIFSSSFKVFLTLNTNLRCLRRSGRTGQTSAK
jgi:hypothetical protein